MNRALFVATFVAGLASVGWVAIGYIGSNPLALAMTVLVGAFYLIGVIELRRFDQATSTLKQALADTGQAPARLGPWLDQVPPSLQNVVRLRIEGERVGLPGPALTPYLAALLVLLGMLGTFAGMIVTLKGTGLALESATDLLSMREALSAPVRGLGLAFGTSVAGVAASAMLGLLSALCRRHRLQVGQFLDSRIATTLRVFSIAHHREESFKLLQQQVQWMPELLEGLKAGMAMMGQQGQALSERLIVAQDNFHTQAQTAYKGLAVSVEQSLQRSLSESAHLVGATIQPVVEATLAAMTREAASLDETLSQHLERQLEGFSTRFDATTASVSALCTSTLGEHQRANAALSQELRASLSHVAQTFDQHAVSLLRTVGQAHSDWQSTQASGDQQRLAAWTQSLEAMTAVLRQEWQQAGVTAAHQLRQLSEAVTQTASDVCAQTAAQSTNTITELAQLVQAAADAPRAAADMVNALRLQLSDSMARDNAMLDERAQVLETMRTVLCAVNHASTDQRAAIDSLVTTAADLLDRVGGRFTHTLETQTDKMSTAAAQLTGSAVEVASLGEAFGFAVQLFSDSNDKLVGQLQRIEGALSQSMSRSDEQLAYYVAQAREVVDLSISSQKQIIDDLRQLATRSAPGA